MSTRDDGGAPATLGEGAPPRTASIAEKSGFGAALLAVLVRMLAWTWRVERGPLPVRTPFVAAFLHGEQLPLVALHRDLPLCGVASQSRDGALLAGVLTRLGYAVLRGSSSRGGAAVLLGAVAALRAGQCPSFAVDGPRGPAGSVAPGPQALARRAGVPLLWVRAEAPGLRLRTWDHFLIPWPFARVRIRYIDVPRDVGLTEVVGRELHAVDEG